MSRLFLTYSSTDRDFALEFRKCFVLDGWQPEEIFIDVDSIGAGDRWKTALRRALRLSDAVIFLVSENSLESMECLVETRVAEELGKPVLPLIIDGTPTDDKRLSSFREYQIVSIAANQAAAPFGDLLDTDALGRLKAELRRIGLAPDHFEWNPFGAKADTNPYPGLRSFTEEEAGVFFGREPEIARAVDVLQELRVRGGGSLFIVGPSGAGKSSFLKAGLWPRFARDERIVPIGVIRPAGGVLCGRQGLAPLAARRLGLPLEEVERRLAHDGATAIREMVGKIVTARRRTSKRIPEASPLAILAIDQGEELLGAIGSEAKQGERLLDAIQPLIEGSGSRAELRFVLLLNLRSDALDALLDRCSVAGISAPELFLLPPIPHGRYRDVILKPAEIARARGVDISIEDDLVDRMVADSEGADALPLMAVSLHEMVERRYGSGRIALTEVDYEALGGGGGALSHQLGEVQRAFAQPDFEDLLRVLLIPHLVTVDPELGQVRRRMVELSDLVSGSRANLAPLARALVEARLLVLDDTRVEIAHEALLRQSPIKEWLQEDAEFLGWAHRLRRERLAYDADRRGLLSGRELDLARGFYGDRVDMLDAEDRAFVEVSLQREAEEREAAKRRTEDLRKAEVAAADARAETARSREAAARRIAARTRIGLGGALVLLVVAIFFAVSAVREAHRADRAALVAQENAAKAERAAAEAQRQADVARGRELVAGARRMFEQTSGRNGTAALLSLEALLLGAGEPAQRLIDDVIAVTPRETRRIPWVNRWEKIEPSPDGVRHYVWRDLGWQGSVATGATVAIDSESGEVLARVDQKGWVRSAISPDGRWLAVAGEGRRLQVVDLSTGTLRLNEARAGMTDVAFAPNGEVLYVVESQGRFETRVGPDWAVSDVEHLQLPGEVFDTGLGIDVAPGGEVLLAFPQTFYMRGADGSFRQLKDVSVSWTNEAKFDPSGRRFVVYTGGRRIQIRTTQDGRLLAEIPPSSTIDSFAFSPDGARIVIGKEDGMIEIWDSSDGSKIREIDLSTKSVEQVGYTREGDLLASFSNGALRLLDPETGDVRRTWSEFDGTPYFGSLDHEDAVLTGDASGRFRRLNFARDSFEEIYRSAHRPESGVFPAATSADGSILVANVQLSRNSGLWTDLTGHDARTGAPIWTASKAGAFRQLIVSPDLKTIATRTQGADGLDIALWDADTGQRREVAGLTVEAIAGFTPDGERLVVKAGAGRVIDVATGETRFELGEPGGVSGVAVGAGGREVYTFGAGELRAWDYLSGMELWRRATDEKIYADFVSGEAGRYVARSADGRSLVVGALASGAEIARIPIEGPFVRFFFSARGDRLIVLYINQKDVETDEPYSALELWDVEWGKLVVPQIRRRATYATAGFAPGGIVFFNTHYGERVTEVFDARTGDSLRSFANPSGYTEASLINAPRSFVTEQNAMIWFPDSGATREIAVPAALYAISPDGKLGVGILKINRHSYSDEIVLIELNTGRVVWRVKAVPEGGGDVGDLLFSTDGRSVLSFDVGAGPEGFLRTFSVADGTKTAELRSSDTAYDIALTADPDIVAVRHGSDTTRIWRISNAEELHRFAHRREAAEVVVARSADRAVTRHGPTLRLWDLRTGTSMAEYDAPSDVSDVAIAPSGDVIAFKTPAVSGPLRDADAKIVTLWRPDAADAVKEIIAPKGVGPLTFDRTGAFLAATTDKTTIAIWRAATGTRHRTLSARPGSTFSDLRFDEDSDIFAVTETSPQDVLTANRGPRSFHMRAWATPEFGEIARLEGAYRNSFGPGAEVYFVGNEGGRVVDLTTGGPEIIEASGFDFCCRPQGLADGWILGYSWREARAFNLRTGREIAVAANHGANDITARAFLPDLSAVFIAERALIDGRFTPAAVRFLSTEDGSPLADPIEPEITVTAIRLFGEAALLLGTPGGIAVRGQYESAVIWRPRDGVVLPLDPGAKIDAAAVSPQANLVALGEGVYEQKDERWRIVGDPAVSLWGGETGEFLTRLTMPAPPESLAFSADGAKLVVRAQGHVRIFTLSDLDRPNETQADRLGKHQSERDFGQGIVTTGGGVDVGFAGDNWVVVPDDDAVRLIWAETGQEVVLPHEPNLFPAFVISEDARFIVTKQRTVARVWRIPESPAPELNAEDLLVATLTVEERGRLMFMGAQNELYQATGSGLRRLKYRIKDVVSDVCRRFGRGLFPVEREAFIAPHRTRNPCAETR